MKTRHFAVQHLELDSPTSNVGHDDLERSFHSISLEPKTVKLTGSPKVDLVRREEPFKSSPEIQKVSTLALSQTAAQESHPTSLAQKEPLERTDKVEIIRDYDQLSNRSLPTSEDW